MRELPLGIPGRNYVEQVVAIAGYKIFRMYLEMSDHVHMAGVKDPFDNGIRPFCEGTGSADCTISAFIVLRTFLSLYHPVQSFRI
jgi:hypothetical protein